MTLSSKPVITAWSNLSKWKALSNKVDTLSSDLLKKVPGFERLYDELSKYPDIEKVLSLLNNESFTVNVFVYLLRNDEDFYSIYLEDGKIIDHLNENLGNAPAYTQRLFKLSYLENLYQQISTNERIGKKTIPTLKDDELISVDFLAECGLLSQNPIGSFVNYSLENDKKPKELIEENEIEISYSSRTFREIESYYILKLIDRVDLKKESDLPHELRSGNFFSVPYNNFELLGHEIIRRILGKISSVVIHHNWIDLILNIASDPRSSRGSEKYLKWWSRIDQKLINDFIKVLSHNDIILFLDAIEDFAEETNNFTMQRMYESRKKLLKGLAIQGLIDESRLILPSRAKRFIHNKRKVLDQSFTINLNEHQGLCVIYLRIGKLHIIEGSHNFSMRVFYGLDHVVDLMKPSIKSMTYFRLIDLDTKYENKTGQKCTNFRHDQSGRWKKRVIQLIRQEVDVDVSLLLTDEESYSLRI